MPKYSHQRVSSQLLLGTGAGFVEAKSRRTEGGPAGICNPISDLQSVWNLLKSSFINLLLIFIPLGFVAGELKWPAAVVFGFNLAGLVPLALLMGDITEDLAIR